MPLAELSATARPGAAATPAAALLVVVVVVVVVVVMLLLLGGALRFVDVIGRGCSIRLGLAV